MKLTPYFQNKKELHYKYRKTRSKAGFLLKKDQINQSISSSIHSLAQG